MVGSQSIRTGEGDVYAKIAKKQKYANCPARNILVDT